MKEDNVQAMVIGADNVLQYKIFHALKSKYQVIGLQNKNSHDDLITIPEYSFDELRILINYYRLNHIIFEITDLKEDVFDLLNRYCDKCSIKIIIIRPDYTLRSIEINHYTFKISIQACKTNRIINTNTSFMICVSIVYGYYDGFFIDKQFNTSVYDKTDTSSPEEKYKLIVNDNIKLYPIIADEIALIVSKKIDEFGILYLHSKKGVTLFEWLMQIKNIFDLTKIQLERDNVIEYDEQKISDIITGAKIMRAQKYCVFNLIYSMKPDQYICGKNVGQFRYEAGKKLGKLLDKKIIDKIDYVVPVPNTGIFYAMGFSEAIQKPYLQAIEAKKQANRSFFIIDYDKRRQTILGKLSIIDDLIINQSIALVDEAIFTGTTLKTLCELLRRKNQVKEIHLCIPTPICKQQCTKYMQPKRDVLSAYINNDMLVDYFDVDSITIQANDGFNDLLNFFNGFCKDCFFDK